MIDLLTALRSDPAINVTGYPGWQSRSNGHPFAPEGIVLHHTASRSTSGPHGSLGIIVNGRSDVPPPLCNITIGRDGSVIVVAAGAANHAGRNSSVALAEMAAGRVGASTRTAKERKLLDDTSGNSRTIGIEIEHCGRLVKTKPADDIEPWRPVVIEATVRVCAALCAAMRWTPGHVTEHRKLTARKPDPIGDTDWWAAIGVLLAPAPVPAQPSEDMAGTVMLLPDGRIVEVTDVAARHIGTPAEVMALLDAGGGPQTTATAALAARVRVT